MKAVLAIGILHSSTTKDTIKWTNNEREVVQLCREECGLRLSDSSASVDKELPLDDSRGDSLIIRFGLCQVLLGEMASVLMGTSQPRLSPDLWSLGFSCGSCGHPSCVTPKFLQDAQAFAMEWQRKNGNNEPDSSLCYKSHWFIWMEKVNVHSTVH